MQDRKYDTAHDTDVNNAPKMLGIVLIASAVFYGGLGALIFLL